jgi:RNA polymerase sigma-70 factor (ECF subfamily)
VTADHLLAGQRVFGGIGLNRSIDPAVNNKMVSREMAQKLAQSKSDRELILELQRGNLDALGELYDRHHQRVYRTALMITNDEEAASDLLQDVFLRMHRFAHRVDPDRPLEPWLYRVTANLSYTWIKKRNRWRRYLQELGGWLNREVRPTPLHQLEIDEQAERVRGAVAALPFVQRVVIVMYYVNDLPTAKIAEILGVPEGTVKSRMYYARNALRKRLHTEAQQIAWAAYEFP